MSETETTTETVIPEHLRVYIPQGRTTARMPGLEGNQFECAIREMDDGATAVMWIADTVDGQDAIVYLSADMCAKLGDQLLFMAALLKRRESDR